jgi:hypothetical protein
MAVSAAENSADTVSRMRMMTATAPTVAIMIGSGWLAARGAAAQTPHP